MENKGVENLCSLRLLSQAIVPTISKLVITHQKELIKILFRIGKKEIQQLGHECIPRSMLRDIYYKETKYNKYPTSKDLNSGGYYGRILFTILIFPKIYIIFHRWIHNAFSCSYELHETLTKNFTTHELIFIASSTVILNILYRIIKSCDIAASRGTDIAKLFIKNINNVIKKTLPYGSSQSSPSGAMEVPNEE